MYLYLVPETSTWYGSNIRSWLESRRLRLPNKEIPTKRNPMHNFLWMDTYLKAHSMKYTSKRLSQDNQFVRIKCFQMLETSALPTHHIICRLYSLLPTIMTTRKQAQQNEGQANFLLQMFFIFNRALATEDVKPTFNMYWGVYSST